jgi:hypothetical protein
VFGILEVDNPPFFVSHGRRLAYISARSNRRERSPIRCRRSATE